MALKGRKKGSKEARNEEEDERAVWNTCEDLHKALLAKILASVGPIRAGRARAKAKKAMSQTKGKKEGCGDGSCGQRRAEEGEREERREKREERRESFV